MPVCSAFAYEVESGMDGSHGNSMFNFLRNYHPVFHSSLTMSLPPTHVGGFQSLHILGNACGFPFLPVCVCVHTANLAGVRWCCCGFDFRFLNDPDTESLFKICFSNNRIGKLRERQI